MSSQYRLCCEGIRASGTGKDYEAAKSLTLQGLLESLRDGQFLDSATAAAAVELLTVNDALRVVGYARISLAAAPWGTYGAAVAVLPLPLRLYAATAAGAARATNDAALLLLLAGFLWSAWAPLSGPVGTWLRQGWASWRLQRRRVRPRVELTIDISCTSL